MEQVQFLTNATSVTERRDFFVARILAAKENSQFGSGVELCNCRLDSVLHSINDNTPPPRFPEVLPLVPSNRP